MKADALTVKKIFSNDVLLMHRSFEFQVGEYFKNLGYEVDVTQAVGDWGVDVFLQKGDEKIAVQAKNYGVCRTRVSRKDLMELYGAMAYFDCHRAVLVYNGRMTNEAEMVAKKLNIQCLYLEYEYDSVNVSEDSDASFEQCWEEYVKPLSGVEIETLSGVKYQVLDVTDSRINFLSSTGKKNNVKVDVFKWTYWHVLNQGEMNPVQIRDEFGSKFSSFVTAVFRYIPQFVVSRPRKISVKKQD